MGDIRARKASHLDLCATDAVAFSDKTTLFDEVELVHEALPELDVSRIALDTVVVDRTLKGPLVISGMTGGIERAEGINKDLASVAEELGLAFGFGSMRPLLQGIEHGYFVRDVAPNAVLLGNLGVVQVRDSTDDQLLELVGRTGVDALAVHLNPAQEAVQDGGDTDFRGGLETLQRVVELLDVPVLAKETGCGISAKTAQRLAACGVSWLDVGGAGGTSWVGVETLRARAATERLGRLFWDWGIPTAASLLQVRGSGMGIVATGGVRHGLDVARALALGASAGGMARPFLMALNEGGRQGVADLAQQVLHEVRIAMLLTGCADVPALRRAPVVLGDRLSRWVNTGPGPGTVR